MMKNNIIKTAMENQPLSLFFLVLMSLIFVSNCGASEAADSANSVADKDVVDSGDTTDSANSVADQDSADSGNSGDQYYFSPTGKVTLSVYTYAGELRSTFQVDDEGDIKIQLDPHYTDDLMVVASRDGAYSELYPTKDGEIITVKLDPVENDGNYHGVVFGYDGYSLHFQKMDYERLAFYGDGVDEAKIPSNVYARYTVADGDYTTVDSWGAMLSDSLDFTPNEQYKYEDLLFKYYEDNGDTAN